MVLSEMMNFPGEVGDVPDVIKKIEYAQLKTSRWMDMPQGLG